MDSESVSIFMYQERSVSAFAKTFCPFFIFQSGRKKSKEEMFDE
jgi:hypothetical protein